MILHYGAAILFEEALHHATTLETGEQIWKVGQAYV